MSRMRTTRLLTVSYSMGGLLPKGCLPGVSAWGDVYPSMQLSRHPL